MNEVDPPDEALIEALSRTYYTRGYEIGPMVRLILLSPQFTDSASNYYKRYAWPVEFVVRSIKEVGWRGFSVNSALTPLVNMGQQLFEPPDVNGWELGQGLVLERRHARAHELRRRCWRRTSASTCATRRAARSIRHESLLSYMLGPAHAAAFASDAYSALLTTREPAAPGPDRTRSSPRKPSGLAHLITGSGDYQLV